VHTLTKEIPRLIKKAGLTPEAIDWLIPHSANIRIIQSACERIGFPAEKTLFSAEYFGNTSSATIPLAIDLGIKEGKIKPGDILLLFGFGGGFTHSGVVVKWDCR
ncbi:MAG: 3-oxoacyl-[acyl-carrier-protein] synthase III C-terminal domain-containing protein, partial [Thermoactinomyces sp.]